MRDNTTSPPVVVNVYLDGQRTESRTLAPTQQESLSLDVSNATNVTLEAVCSSQSIYCDRVYFFNAALEERRQKTAILETGERIWMGIQTPP